MQVALEYANDKDKKKNENFKAKISYQLLKIKFNIAISNTYRYDKKLGKTLDLVLQIRVQEKL